MSRFIIAPQARLDLAEILDYIADDRSIHATLRIRGEIDAAFEKLAHMPGMGHTHEELGNRPLRVWPVHFGLIIYRPIDDGVEIVRVIHGARDVGSMFPQ